MRIGSDKKWRSQGAYGFAYVLLLIAVAVIGATAGRALEVSHAIYRRELEQQLLWVGAEFEKALRAYGTTGGLTANGALSLEELLKDPHSPEPRRYLRQIYFDPLTSGKEWGLIRNEGGFIVGVYSLASGVPLKKDDFDLAHAHFRNAENYQQWVFSARPIDCRIVDCRRR